jgi:CIC family chloride channel protein
VSQYQSLLIVDAQGNLEGIITRSDLLRALNEDPKGVTRVLEAGTREVVVTYPDELMHDALLKMLRRQVGRLPVVRRDNPRQVVGYLGRHSILAARLLRMEEEHVREPGWGGRLFAGNHSESH